MSRMFRSLVSLLVLLLLGCTAAFSQSDKGQVSGQVTDPQALAVPNVKLQLVNQDTSAVVETDADDTGHYRFVNVPPGRYYAFAADGWSPLWQNADFLRQIQNQGAGVDVPENGHVQVQLSVITIDQMQAAAIPLGLTAQ